MFGLRAASSIMLLSSSVLVGCGSGGGGSRSTPPIVVPLERSLADAVLFLDPNVRPPSAFEHDALRRHDDALHHAVDHLGDVFLYDEFVDAALDRAGVSLDVSFRVASDFRFDGAWAEQVAGVAGGELLVFDGKLLDILWEYSVYLALWEVGLEDRSPEDAIDVIVLLHQDVLGPTPDGFLYRIEDLGPAGQSRALSWFEFAMDGLVLRSFAHVYLGHALEALRVHGHLPDDPLRYVADARDDADLVAGMLLARVDGDLALAQEQLDVVEYTIAQRFDRDVTYFDILSRRYQEALVDGLTLLQRKATWHLGYDIFFHAWR